MTDTATTDWPALVDDLNRLLRLKTTPIAMKLFERVEDMRSIAKIRRPNAIHTADQIVAQAARLGFTVGITRDDLVGRVLVKAELFAIASGQIIGRRQMLEDAIAEASIEALAEMTWKSVS